MTEYEIILQEISIERSFKNWNDMAEVTDYKTLIDYTKDALIRYGNQKLKQGYAQGYDYANSLLNEQK